jgi:hypothetical protein
MGYHGGAIDHIQKRQKIRGIIKSGFKLLNFFFPYRN